MSTTMNFVPETIDRITDGVYPTVAMVAGMQLDLFTPLERGPMTGEEIAQAIGGGTGRVSGRRDRFPKDSVTRPYCGVAD